MANLTQQGLERHKEHYKAKRALVRIAIASGEKTMPRRARAALFAAGQGGRHLLARLPRPRPAGEKRPLPALPARSEGVGEGVRERRRGAPSLLPLGLASQGLQGGTLLTGNGARRQRDCSCGKRTARIGAEADGLFHCRLLPECCGIFNQPPPSPLTTDFCGNDGTGWIPAFAGMTVLAGMTARGGFLLAQE